MVESRSGSLYASKGLITYEEDTGRIALRNVQGESFRPEVDSGGERELIYVGISGSGKLNVRVTGDIDEKRRNEIIRLVLETPVGQTSASTRLSKKKSASSIRSSRY
jgi:hypothetical protein